MYHQEETNPHFLTPEQQLKRYPPPRQNVPRPHFYPQPRPEHRIPPSQSQGPNLELVSSQPQPHQPHSQPQPHQPHSQPQPRSHLQSRQHQPSPLRVPQPRKTKALAWFIAVFCALFWITIIIGGLAILIIYLLFQPRSPKFDISTATLNGAYVDMGYLLNADLTLLTNFTNPNKKVTVDYTDIVLDLYYEGTPVASSYIIPFSTKNRESKFAEVRLVTSQVRLSLYRIQQLSKQMDNGRIRFEVKGLFRTRSNLGGFLKYSYWLYGHCTIVVTRPPSGVLIAKKCTTKR